MGGMNHRITTSFVYPKSGGMAFQIHAKKKKKDESIVNVAFFERNYVLNYIETYMLPRYVVARDAIQVRWYD